MWCWADSAQARTPRTHARSQARNQVSNTRTCEHNQHDANEIGDWTNAHDLWNERRYKGDEVAEEPNQHEELRCVALGDEPFGAVGVGAATKADPYTQERLVEQKQRRASTRSERMSE
jgi:hypothetical protein